MFLSRAQFVLLSSTGLAIGIIYFVHHSQSADRKVRKETNHNHYAQVMRVKMLLQRLHQGVERDVERQLRKERNRRKLEEQLVLEESLHRRDNQSNNKNE